MHLTAGERKGATVGALAGVLLAIVLSPLPYGFLSFAGLALLGAFLGAATLND